MPSFCIHVTSLPMALSASSGVIAIVTQDGVDRAQGVAGDGGDLRQGAAGARKPGDGGVA
jgi:hypothetical protein